MVRKITMGLAALLVSALLSGALPESAVAVDGFFPNGHAPTEAEVRAWTDRVKAFRETLGHGENGRFSAVRIDATSVFLLDTRLGHLWVWTFGEKGSFTTYQGQLLPGLTMGDIVGASAGRKRDGGGGVEKRK
ncbi:MAG: hypothetical protein PVG78_06610 [Desulfobacterales bacterium]|jgi:hypothetical protein